MKNHRTASSLAALTLGSVFISPPTRVPGTAVFLVSDQGLTPNALLHKLKRNKGAA